MSNFICPQCGETNIDSPEGYVSGCECLKSDTECLPISKRLEERAIRTEKVNFEGTVLSFTKYTFTPEELKAYKEALCREQRELCAEAADDSVQEVGGISKQLWDAIINAEEP